MVKDEYIGTFFTYRLPSGYVVSGTVTQDPNKYEFYRSCELDYIFEKSERELIIEELDALGIKYRKNSSLETLKKKLNDSINKGTSKYEYSFNPSGEDNAE